jgi:two-component system sensor histidine kinase RegB
VPPELSVPLAAPPAPDAAPAHLAGRLNLLHLIELRWLAVGGQLLTIGIAQWLMGVQLPLAQMLTLLLLLAVFNAASWVRSRGGLPVTQVELFAGLLMDVAVLTGQLYYSGGVRNPFIFLYLLQVAVASVLLRPRFTWAIFGATSVGFAALTVWHQTLVLPTIEDYSLQYIGGLFACFVLDAALLVIFIERISRSLRERDASLAQLRQRAAEQEHILRMGLLASGAAHELGTPLATLSVILGDWARMAPFAGEPELREEIEEMQRQIDRCKQIVSSILASAGESRAEALERVPLQGFVDTLAHDWQRSRAATLDYHRIEVPEVRIMADPALKQMIANVLDNALEAAPGLPLLLEVRGVHDDDLIVRVRDRGPGFPAQVIERLGAPYTSTKPGAGRGLGLFLAVNVARTLGGSIRAQNLKDGAEVVITLPLAALTVDADGPE